MEMIHIVMIPLTLVNKCMCLWLWMVGKHVPT